MVDSDPELGIELALEAARIEPTERAEEALRLALDASRVRDVIDTGHPVVGMDVDPTGPRVLVVGDDGNVRLYDLETGDARWSHRVDGAAAAYTEGGRSVVVIAGSKLVTLDAATGKPRRAPVPIALPAPWRSWSRARTGISRSSSPWASRGPAPSRPRPGA